MIWIQFITIAAVIIILGSWLPVLAERLAKQFHISSSAVGLLLVSIITSLPELSTSLSAVIKIGQPNLSVGNNLGSDVFNLMIIALCDLLFRKGGILRQITQRSTTPFLYYLFMISALLMTLILPNSVTFFGGHFNIGSLLVIASYLFIFFRTHRRGKTNCQGTASDKLYCANNSTENIGSADRTERNKILLQFSFVALVIIIAGTILAHLGDQISERTGLEQSFIGTLLLALVTSLPELAVSISALKIGAIDLMVGNILGSNIFNVLITAIADISYRKKAFHIPNNINPGLLWIGGCSIAMICLVLVASRQKKKAKWVAWESILTLTLYLIALFALYRTANPS